MDPITPTPTPQPQFQPPPQPQPGPLMAAPKSSPLKNASLIILGLLLLAGAVYGGVWWQAGRQAPVPVGGETANWQTYRNEEYGFEIKYPKEFAIKDSLNGTNNPELTLVINYMKPACDNCGGDSKYLWISAGPKRPGFRCEGASDAINIGGIIAARCIYSGSYFGEGEGLFVDVTKGNYTYTFNADFYDRNKIVVDEILSTFKFTKNGSTYTYYSNRGFSIELPKGFTPSEYQAEGGPAFQISLPVGGLAYVTDPAFWEKYNIPSYTYIKEQKFGNNIFKIYLSGKDPVYWFKIGNIGYEFSVSGADKLELENLLKTFTILTL